MKALIIVDVQNDFAPWGALPVPAGDRVVPVINRIQNAFPLVVATQDWHPPNHKSFASQHRREVGETVSLDGVEQILWPDHCVQNTDGAAFIEGLNLDNVRCVFRKGMDVNVDSYSGFFDNDHRRSTGLDQYLADQKVTEVFVAGLATDYCVKFTALDARRLGFETWVIEDASQGVALNSGDVETALTEMRQAGIRIVRSGVLPVD